MVYPHEGFLAVPIYRTVGAGARVERQVAEINLTVLAPAFWYETPVSGAPERMPTCVQFEGMEGVTELTIDLGYEELTRIVRNHLAGEQLGLDFGEVEVDSVDLPVVELRGVFEDDYPASPKVRRLALNLNVVSVAYVRAALDGPGASVSVVCLTDGGAFAVMGRAQEVAAEIRKAQRLAMRHSD